MGKVTGERRPERGEGSRVEIGFFGQTPEGGQGKKARVFLCEIGKNKLGALKVSSSVTKKTQSFWGKEGKGGKVRGRGIHPRENDPSPIKRDNIPTHKPPQSV